MKCNRSSLRTIEIIEYISKCSNGCTLNEITKALSMPKSSCYDIIQTLLFKDMIVEDLQSGKIKYRVSIHSFIVMSNILDKIDIVELSKDPLKNLAKQNDSTAFLATLDDGMVTYLYKYESADTAITTANIGTRISPHCTALGKAMLAFMNNEQEVTQILKKMNFKAYTDYTITSITKYLAELENVRSKGYAVDNKENINQSNMRCVSNF